MQTYYAIYKNEIEGDPVGMFILDPSKGRALIWNHRIKAWSYEPGLDFRSLEDCRNVDRYREIDESEARQVALAVTGGDLPGEGQVVARFRGREPVE
ncbi:hypothetical protein MCAG_03803 [Micromonospora sp. ATCC 39149]|uniref:Uncharacterized protein n=1 Tax=Micromonospora carbonacea TaxID=47853 RepID=A0A7D6CF71_9ACTN|nr:hypothetical protein [Micromonospora sp. ATCC 39149]EEP73476.1 hypothetical protein MCAG_03803 [Micromonospora sp. ATCC 39149]QLJ99468.1 hypothetical protein HZU44_04855 [Micromonospora carbonacea]